MCVQDLVRHAAQRFGDAPAPVEGDRTVSFTEFEQRTQRLGNALLGMGTPTSTRRPNWTWSTG